MSFPIALTPASPPRALNQQVAIDAWADAVIAAAPELPEDPATDILCPPPSANASTAVCRPSTGDDVDAIVRAVTNLDHSYLAVQGPPGTGKTYVGSHVIARLIREHGYKVGVVAQSHAVVENMLDRVVAAGDPARAGRQGAEGSRRPGLVHRHRQERRRRVHREARRVGLRLRRHRVGLQSRGPHPAGQPRPARHRRGRPVLARIDDRRVARVAAAAAARRPAAAAAGEPGHAPRTRRHVGARLGHGRRRRDPGRSTATSWRARGACILPSPSRFHACRTTASSRRIRPPCCASSRASSPACTPSRCAHLGNATQSPEEAAVVVAIVRDLVGRAWSRHPDR